MKLPDYERASAVDRIDNPGKSITTRLDAVLFADDAVAGIDAGDLVTNRGFGVAIGDRDRIVAARAGRLVLDIERRAEIRQDSESRDFGEASRKRSELDQCAIVKNDAAAVFRHRVSPYGS